MAGTTGPSLCVRQRTPNAKSVAGILQRMWKQHRVTIVLALVVGAGYGGHMLYRYVEIRKDFASRASKLVRPTKDDGNDVVEVGYIYSMRDEVFLRDDNRVNLIWFVKVPATSVRT